jgi:hypothetical protein
MGGRSDRKTELPILYADQAALVFRTQEGCCGPEYERLLFQNRDSDMELDRKSFSDRVLAL